MNRSHSEGELAGRLGDDRDEAARLDALVRASAERDVAIDRVAAERDREAVLARIAAPTTRRERRMPWWRVAAPFAVAAGLAGLFFWNETEAPPAPESATDTARVAEVREDAEAREPVGRSAAPDAADADGLDLAADEPGSNPTGTSSKLAADPLPVAAGRAARVDALTLRVESLLRRLGTPAEPVATAGAARDSLVRALREVRPRIDDRDLARRADAWVGETH